MKAYLRPGKRHENLASRCCLLGSIPVSGVVSGVLAGKSCRRDANTDTRDAGAPQQKKLAAWILCHVDAVIYNAFAPEGAISGLMGGRESGIRPDDFPPAIPA